MQSVYMISLKESRHKRRPQHQMIMMSNDTDMLVKPMTVNPGFLWTVGILLCLLMGALFGYFYVARGESESYRKMIAQQGETILSLEAEKQELLGQIDTLTDRVQILSDTVNSKVASEAQLTEVIEQQSIPSGYPLTGAASMEEVTEGDPGLIFQAAEGSFVVASAAGTVVKVEADETYGNQVWIDHGNGYVSIYRNKGDVMVKAGDTVAGGNTVYMVGKDNHGLNYQIQYNGEYIDPIEMIEISG